MTIVVIGATGKTGVPTVRGLLAAGAAVRVYVRNPDRVRDQVGDAGGSLDIVRGELHDTMALTSALADADAAFVALNPIGDQGLLQRAVIAAAAAVGLPQLVRLSVLSARPESPGLVQRGHAELDEFAAATGLGYTSLQPAIFMSSVLDAAPAIRSERRWIGTAGQGRNPLIDPRDVAAVAAAVLQDPTTWGKPYELTGPALYSWPDVAAALGLELGGSISFDAVSEEEFRAASAKRGVPGHLVEVLVARERGVAAGDNERVTDDVRRLTGTEPRTLAAFLHENRAAFLPADPDA
jgi:uncharacterized protein YbjT (DUF2867 family)